MRGRVLGVLCSLACPLPLRRAAPGPLLCRLALPRAAPVQQAGKSQFMKFASKLSQRAVMTTGRASSAAGLTAAAVQEGAAWTLEAGALVLADGGLCCIDEFDGIREADRWGAGGGCGVCRVGLGAGLVLAFCSGSVRGRAREEGTWGSSLREALQGGSCVVFGAGLGMDGREARLSRAEPERPEEPHPPPHPRGAPTLPDRRLRRASIHEAMEQQTVSVAKASMVVTLQTRAAVFGTCNPRGNRRYNPRQPLATQLAIGGPLLSRFDIVLLLLDDLDPAWDGLISDHILEAHAAGGRAAAAAAATRAAQRGPDPQAAAVEQQPQVREGGRRAGGWARVRVQLALLPPACGCLLLAAYCLASGWELRRRRRRTQGWTIDMLRQYVAWAKQRFSPILSPEAEELLGGYYALRRAGAGRQSSRTTVRMLESLVRLAQAHARLMARDEVGDGRARAGRGGAVRGRGGAGGAGPRGLQQDSHKQLRLRAAGTGVTWASCFARTLLLLRALLENQQITRRRGPEQS